MTNEAIEHDPSFSDWETEKAFKLRKLAELAAYVAEAAKVLHGYGIQGLDASDSKLKHIIGMLVKKGLITEKDVLDMELAFMEGCCNELDRMCKQVRAQTLLVPQANRASGLIVPNK